MSVRMRGIVLLLGLSACSDDEVQVGDTEDVASGTTTFGTWTGGSGSGSTGTTATTASTSDASSGASEGEGAQSYCGDGFRGPGEQCDDGDDDDDDACTNDCRIVVCGDGRITGSETCEPMLMFDATCETVTGGEQMHGTAVCDPMTCRLDTSGCWTCGDGILDTQTEQCDDGNDVDDDACSNTCRRARCGDRIVQAGAGEECDDGNTWGGDGCSSTCKILHCGNGILEPERGEACDDGNTDDHDACTTSCRPAACGDGYVQLPEVCDDGDTDDHDECSADCSSGVCRVPRAFATIQAAIDDPRCSGVAVEPGEYRERLTIDRDLVLTALGDHYGTETLVDAGGEGSAITILAGEVSLVGFGITGGAAELGGGIHNEGTLHLERCMIRQNTASGSDPRGGGIFSTGPLTLNETAMYANTVEGEASGAGGGLSVLAPGTLVVIDSTISDNAVTSRAGDVFGGNVHLDGAVAEIRSSSLSAGRVRSSSLVAAEAAGGSIYIEGGALELQATSLFDNRVILQGSANSVAYGGAIRARDADVTLRRVQLMSNGLDVGLTPSGGGALSVSSQSETRIELRLEHVVVNGGDIVGSESFGAGLHAEGPMQALVDSSSFVYIEARPSRGTAMYFGETSAGAPTATVVNSTISQNTGGLLGGGAIFAAGPDTVVHVASSTLVDSQGLDADEGEIRVKNSILSTTSCNGVVSAGHNLVVNSAACAMAPAEGDLLDENPVLVDLYWYYYDFYSYVGFTPFHALDPSSPAVDAGDPDGCTASFDGPGTALASDQRGTNYPRHVGRCDIGAYEYP